MEAVNQTLENLEKLEKLLKLVDNLKLQQASNELSPIELAKLQTALAFALASVFYVQRNIKGQEVVGHAINDDISRIKSLVGQIKKQENEEPPEKKPRIDKPAANRMIAHHL
jgi:hypothetical protein